jgi:hypothetical protein
MLFLLGERIRKDQVSVGRRACVYCGADQKFVHVTEDNYFTFFAIPLFRLGNVADYCQCESCEYTYQNHESAEPAHVCWVKLIATYVLTGYGMANQRRIIQEIGKKVSGVDFPSDEIDEISTRLEDDVFELLRSAAASLNDKGKLKIVETAFLATYICCEVQYEDRLRINLIGNALGVSLQFVEYAIGEVRRQNYYGVHRLLSPTR